MDTAVWKCDNDTYSIQRNITIKAFFCSKPFYNQNILRMTVVVAMWWNFASTCLQLQLKVINLKVCLSILLRMPSSTQSIKQQQQQQKLASQFDRGPDSQPSWIIHFCNCKIVAILAHILCALHNHASVFSVIWCHAHSSGLSEHTWCFYCFHSPSNSDAHCRIYITGHLPSSCSCAWPAEQMVWPAAALARTATQITQTQPGRVAANTNQQEKC